MNSTVLGFANWLQNTSFGMWIAGSEWIYPFVQATHFTGLSFWVGTSVALDLRLIGIGKKRETAAELSKALFVWNWIGFGVAILGGFCLFSVSAVGYVINPAFRTKLGVLVPMVLIWHIVVQRKVSLWGESREVTSMGKIAGFVELFLWISVVTAAVSIPYFESHKF
jgi:hypothetical protein